MSTLRPFEETEAAKALQEIWSGNRIRITIKCKVTSDHTLALANLFQRAAYKAVTGQNLSEVLGEDKVQVRQPDTIDIDYTEESPKLIE